MIRLPLAVAALALVAAPALAQPANLRPTRDVSVTYRMSGIANAPPQEVRMDFSASTGKQRLDPPGGMGWMLVDRQAGSAVMVMDAQRTIMTLPREAAAAMTQEVPAGATFARKGTATVAGTACTEWDMTAGEARGTSCITDDGVLLRSTTTVPGGAAPTTITMEATRVAYGPIDPARVTVPSGYATMQMPAGAPGAPGAAR